MADSVQLQRHKQKNISEYALAYLRKKSLGPQSYSRDRIP